MASEIKTWILYTESTGKGVPREEFLFQLGEQLTTKYKKERNF
jgi:hypothetical protein